MTSLTEHFLSRTLKFHQLKLAVEVDKTGSLIRAAENLNITQSAATKILKQLETTLEVKLFTRHAHGTRATVYGEHFIKHAKIILSQLRYSADEIEALKSGSRGKIIVGTLIAATFFLLPTTIAALLERYKNLDISVIEGTNDKLIPALKQGEVDIIVGRLSPLEFSDNLLQHYLYDDPIRIVCSANHPILKSKRKITLKDLVKLQWVLPPADTNLRAEIEKSFSYKGLPIPSKAIESVSIITNINLIEHSQFIAALPSHFISPLVKMGRLSYIPVDLKATSSPIGYTVRNIELPNPALMTFIEQLTQTADIARDQIG